MYWLYTCVLTLTHAGLMAVFATFDSSTMTVFTTLVCESDPESMLLTGGSAWEVVDMSFHLCHM